MLIFRSDKGYCVSLENDGNDLWVSVTNGYCNSYDCIVGTKDDFCDVKMCLETAYSCFYPAQYIKEYLCADDDRFRVLCLTKDAFEIDRALEMAISA